MISAIIQARVGSTRLPGKIFAEISGKPLLWHVVNRLKSSRYLNSIIIATTSDTRDDKIEEWATKNNINCFRGSENDVLNRYYEAAKKFNVNIIVRITSDDPFKDFQIMDRVIEKLKIENADFTCNNNPPSFPEGLDIEVFTFEAIEKANRDSVSDFEREHVTQYFYKNPHLFKISTIKNSIDLSNLRWTIDEEIDLKMTRVIYDKLYNKDKPFLMNDILKLIKNHPEISNINNNVKRSTLYK